ncbi:MAG: UPF0149 family protein, partial [Steroidobacteraceae bacterium]|nr:UPF0149 family protein [Steroidobacteraceae bacterium]
MNAPGFAALQRTLVAAGALTDAPEAHGTLAGAFCADDSYRFDQWLAELFADGRVDEPANEALRQLFDDLRSTLHASELGTIVLLPDDDQPLAARAAALGQW